jgi:hypothetical protein
LLLRRGFLLPAALPVLARLARFGARFRTLLAPRFDAALLANSGAACGIPDRGRISPHTLEERLRVMHTRLDRERLRRSMLRAARAMRRRRTIYARALDDGAHGTRMVVDCYLRRVR